MKRLWVIQCVVMLMLSSCVVGPDSFAPTPIADHTQYADVILEYASARSRKEIFEYPSGGIVTVISMAELAMDSWLLGWALEAVSKDLTELAGEVSPNDEGFLIFVWLYANSYAASALRCAEERHELGELIETFAAKIREKRADTTLHRLVVANTLWKQLSEGEASCTAYLADLSADEFIPVRVNERLQFTMVPLPAGMSKGSIEGSGQGDTESTVYALYRDHNYENIAVISLSQWKADEWLHRWAKETLTRDRAEANILWIEDSQEYMEWLYANGFFASERRCAEGREELAALIENQAEVLRSEGAEKIRHSRMSVMHTIWHNLPEGDTFCALYLSDLAIEDYMPIMVGGELQYIFGSR